METAEDWMQTWSGVRFSILHPTEDMIQIEDIAHALSHICRYGGHCNRFYSVAEHSILLAEYVYSVENNSQMALEALLHDATEAYYCDIPRPFKYNLPLYREFEMKLEKIMANKFGMSYPMAPWLKDLDSRMLKTEKNQIMNSHHEWYCDNLEPLPIKIPNIPPNQKALKTAFLHMFDNYVDLMVA
jgi:hypothetical protein